MSDFTGMIKHVGMLTNTGKNVVVVYMQLPGDPNHALVVDTDALPDNYNDSLRRVVESTEGQQSENLAEVLARRMSPDGSNTTLLNKFHQAGRLQKVPTNLIIMTPRKGVRWPLTEVLQAMESMKQSTPDGFDDLDPETRAAVAADLKKFNVHANNIEGEARADRKDEAIGLIRQAELLESDAQTMRERAYRMDPSLKKTTKSSVKSSVINDLPILTTAPMTTKTKTVKKSATTLPVAAAEQAAKPAKPAKKSKVS
jgi:hypothetical protein